MAIGNKSVNADGRDAWYYLTLLDYIHLNPVRAGMIKPKEGQSVVDYPWSSVASGYAVPARRRAPWLAAGVGLEESGFADDAQGRRHFVERLDERGRQEARRTCGVAEGPENASMSNLRRGWYWGTQAFSEKLLALAEGMLKLRQNSTYRSGPVQHQHDEKQAERLAIEGIERLRLSEEELATLPGSDSRKVEIARELRAKTSVPLGWIAGRLSMRSAANVSRLLHLSRQ